MARADSHEGVVSSALSNDPHRDTLNKTLCNKGMTPLQVAARCGNKDVAEYLLDAGAEIDYQDDLGYTALHHAASSGSLALAKFLLERGANKDAINRDGWAVIHVAAEYNSFEVIKLLVQRGVHLNTRIIPRR